MASRLALLWIFATPAASLLIAPAVQKEEASPYPWPEPRGKWESYSVSPYTGPRELTTSFAWKWENGGPEGKYSQAAHSGVVIDDHNNIYLASTDGIRKFSSEGKLLWQHPMTTWRIPTLYKGGVYVTDNGGMLTALSMETGDTLWTKKVITQLGTDISGVGVHNGVVVAESNGDGGGGAHAVIGMDATDGNVLWEFPVEAMLWNFMPMFTDNETFVFQDRTGGSYHHRLQDGKRIWRSGYGVTLKSAVDVDFTDGMTMLADGVVYTSHSDGTCCGANQTADLRAYDLSSGRELWVQRFGHPSNSQPAVGHLGQGTGLSKRLAVVVPIGAQPVMTETNYLSSISAFDAKTGEPIWEWKPPAYWGRLVAGDEERYRHGTLCLPNPYSSPTIDARGTVYVGHFNGYIYAIRDDNGDNIIQDSEVSKLDTGAGFSHGGAAIAPGMLAIPTCDALYVFKV